jgi:hypothetical protein
MDKRSSQHRGLHKSFVVMEDMIFRLPDSVSLEEGMQRIEEWLRLCYKPSGPTDRYSWPGWRVEYWGLPCLLGCARMS